jgi:hypothetical protein
MFYIAQKQKFRIFQNWPKAKNSAVYGIVLVDFFYLTSTQRLRFSIIAGTKHEVISSGVKVMPNFLKFVSWFELY